MFEKFHRGDIYSADLSLVSALNKVALVLYSFFKIMWEIVSVLRLLLQQLPV